MMSFRKIELLRAFHRQEFLEALASEKLARSPEQDPKGAQVLGKMYEDALVNRDLVVSVLEPHESRLFDAWRAQPPGSATRAAFIAIVDDPFHPDTWAELTSH